MAKTIEKEVTVVQPLTNEEKEAIMAGLNRDINNGSKPKNTAIYKAINEVSIAIEEVKKTGYSDQHKQSYLSAQDLMAALKPQMNAKGLIIHEDRIENEELKAFTSNGKQQYCYSATYIFKMNHAESGEFIFIPAKGVGFDFGDKACYKAATLALKYALQHIFFVVTKDDPEADTEHAPAKTKAPTATDKAKDARNDEYNSDPAFISKAQGGRLFAIYKKAGKTPEIVNQYLLENYKIKDVTGIKKDWYEAICTWAEGSMAANDAPAHDPDSDIPF